nr:MAG TPA: hypothetical protein [Caudoviricetes sp.]
MSSTPTDNAANQSARLLKPEPLLPVRPAAAVANPAR